MINSKLETLEARRLLSAGDVDASFGIGGKITGHADYPKSEREAYISDIALQSDGKSVAVGSLLHVTDYNEQRLLFIARYHADGTLDTSYGTNGYTTVDFGGIYSSVGHAVTVDSNGRAVVAGSVHNPDKLSFAVARFTTNGKLDTSFSGDGIAIANFAQKTAVPNDIAIAPDGKIVVAGYSSNGPGTARFAVARFKTNGMLDNGFSVDGLQTIDADAANDEAHAVSVLPDGRVLLAGYLTKAGADSDMAIVRLTNTGQLDKTFDGNGIAAYDLGGNEEATALLVDGDRYVLAGKSKQDSGLVSTILRTSTSGALDSNFRNGGQQFLTDLSQAHLPVLATLGPDNTYRVFATHHGVHEVRLNKSGEIVAQYRLDRLPEFANTSDAEAVGAQTRSNGSSVLAVRVHNRETGFDGFPIDFFQISTIKADGSTAEPKLSGPAFAGGINDLAVTIDGKLAMVGRSQFDYLFYRFNADGSLDKTFAKDGRAELPGLSSSLLGAPSLLILPDGSLVGYGTDRDTGDPDPIAVTMRRVFADGSIDADYARDFTPWGIVADESGNADVTLLPGGYITIVYDQYTTDNRWAVLVRPDGKGSSARIPGAEYLEKLQDMPTAFRPIGRTEGFFATGLRQSPETFEYVPAIAKYKSVTEIDTSYGDGGFVEGTFDLVIAQADGKFLYRADGGLRRRTQTGAGDTSFGNNGLAASGYANFTFDSHDRIIAWKNLSNGDVQIARFTPDGKTDKSFGGGDGVTTVKPTVKGEMTVVVNANDDLVITSLKKTSTRYNWFATRLSGGGFADLANGKLTVHGSTANDRISMSVTGSLINVTVNGKSKSFSKSKVSGIEVYGFGGDDTINIGSTVPAVRVDGGDGNDVITGSGGNDTMIGGFGNDALLGKGGRDLLEGSSGDDYLEGGDGNDTMIGGNGNDALDGGAGSDSMSGGAGNDRFYAKDGVRDSLDGGAGSDTAKRDKSGSVKDSVLNIESFV